MNSFAVITFFACVAAANADGLYHGSSGHILQGASSKTAVLGPDGSVIKAVAPGGQIINEEQPGFVAQTAPVYRHEPLIYRHEAPIYRHEAPVYRYATPIYRHSAPAVTYASRSVVRHVPSLTYGAPLVHAAPTLAYGAPLSHSYRREGQYAHDYSELLSDDGSYKHHLY